jgi:cytochrome c oxidase subunit 3
MIQAAETIAGRWDGGVCPFNAGWRKLMLWWFIVTDGLVFAGLLAGYGYARMMATAWPEQGDVFSLPFIAAMTFVLISSSATMASAVAAATGPDRTTVARFVGLTLVGGAAFLIMQAFEWRHLIAEGARLDRNPWGDRLFGSYFFLITGFHGSHVLTGLIVLATLALRWNTGRARPESVELAGLYWHFVDLVWVFVFTCFYLI